MKKVFTLLVFTLCSSLLFAQTTLEYHLKKGDTFTIRQNAHQIITQELDGAAHKITNRINGLIEFKVLGKVAGHYELSITFRDLHLNMTSSIQGELMNVNAQEVSEENIQSKIFNSLLNIPIQMILAKNGDIIEVHGGDSLVSRMASSSGIQDAFSLNLMKKSLEKEFGSEALSQSYKQMTYIYPDQIVNVGDSWENEYAGKLSAKNVWTLDAITIDHALITGRSSVLMDVKEVATTMRLEGTQETSITTDFRSGFIKSMTVTGSSEGISTMAQIGDQEIPTTIASTITYELVETMPSH
ncbi:MAG TPA: DUF6263 family protein [Eudoraea sp.]|nr:DUF6263 family protein [Eudoraea sp.]